MKALAVFAHPDDETILLGGWIQRYASWRWTVVCVTDGNAFGRGSQRLQELHQACERLKVARVECLNLPDVLRGRLDSRTLINLLKKFSGFHRVYTHNIFGEYGHLHHQDVSYAVHMSLGARVPTFSVAWNLYPEQKIALRRREYLTKVEILTKIYAQENRLHDLERLLFPFEGVVRMDQRKVQAVYRKF